MASVALWPSAQTWKERSAPAMIMGGGDIAVYVVAAESELAGRRQINQCLRHP
jgi:hypothetical protein